MPAFIAHLSLSPPPSPSPSPHGPCGLEVDAVEFGESAGHLVEIGLNLEFAIISSS